MEGLEIGWYSQCKWTIQADAVLICSGEERELSVKATLSSYHSNYDHGLRVVTERMRLWIHALEMSFLQSVAELYLRGRMRRWVKDSE